MDPIKYVVCLFLLCHLKKTLFDIIVIIFVAYIRKYWDIENCYISRIDLYIFLKNTSLQFKSILTAITDVCVLVTMV